MERVGYFFAAVSLVGLVLQIFGIVAIRLASAIQHRSRRLTTYPSVSIVKPLCGSDYGLRQNLASYFRLEYPGEIELIFALKSMDDPAYSIARELSQQYPNAVTKFAFGQPERCTNPKSAGVLVGIAASSNEVIWQTDACIFASSLSLSQIVERFEAANRGLLCSIPSACGEQNLFASFHNAYVCCYLSPAISFLNEFLGYPCTLGKSLMFARTTFEELGSSQVMMEYLAEDYLLGEHFQLNGRTVTICAEGELKSVNSYLSFRDFLNRQLRWLTMRAKISYGALVGDILFNPIAFGLVATALNSKLSISFALMVFIAKTLLDCVCCVVSGRASFSLGSILLMPVREILIVGIGLIAFFNSRVSWRNSRYTIGRRSQILKQWATGI